MNFNPIESLKNLYKANIHKFEKECTYPWLDRVVSYVVPTAGAAAYATFGKHKDYDISKLTHKTDWLPAGVAFYLSSQAALTYVKPYADSMNKGVVKSVVEFTLKLFDNANNIVLYIPAYNLLPDSQQLNSVFAFRVLPAIVKGIESDFSSWRNGTSFESEVAGRVYAEAFAGGFAANISTYLSDEAKKLDPKFDATDENSKSTHETDAYLAETFSDAILYSGIKKLLVGERYKSGEIKTDILQTVLKDAAKKIVKIKEFEEKIGKGSVYENFMKVFLSTTLVETAFDCIEFMEDPEITSALESSVDAAKINLAPMDTL
jgi:hypothetical protein